MGPGVPEGGLLRFTTLLLDLNQTFMFGGDRFGAGQDFHATYRALGGTTLQAAEVQHAVATCCAVMGGMYVDPLRYDAFPGVAEVLREHTSLADRERAQVEAVIAEHELGRVPDEYAAALHRLAASHRIGLVSNLWSRKDRWISELDRAGVLDLLEVAIFSSDGRSIKPSPRPFDEAVERLRVRRSETVYIGDSLRCDVAGAANAGLRAIWIDPAGTPLPPGAPAPEWTVRDLLDLV